MSTQPTPVGGLPAAPEMPDAPRYNRHSADQRMQIRSGQSDPWAKKLYRRSDTGGYNITEDPNRNINQATTNDVAEKGANYDVPLRNILDRGRAMDSEATQSSISQAWNQERMRQEQEYASVYAEAQQVAGTPYKTNKGWSIKQLDTNSLGQIRTQIVNAAVGMVNTPNLQYSWGGGGARGPSYGINDGIGPASRNVYGFDCSGLVQYAYAKAGINIGRHSTAQSTAGRIVGISSLKPGDIVGWGRTPQTATHVAIYLGNGYIAEAANTKDDLQIRKIGSWPMDKQAFGVAVMG